MEKHQLEISEDLSSLLFDKTININLIQDQKLKQINKELTLLIVVLSTKWNQIEEILNHRSLNKILKKD